MLRRALLFLCLAAPLAARAQTTDSVTITPAGPFGVIACDGASTDTLANPAMRIDWTLTTTAAITTSDKWRILASTSNTCPTTDTGLVATQDALAGTNTGVYPPTGSTTITLKFLDLLTFAGTDCSGTADKVIYVCVALRRANATTDEKSKIVTFTLQKAPPPVPVGMVVTPGNNALNIAWSEGTPGTGEVATDRYTVTVTPHTPSDDPAGTRTISKTASRSVRQAGLLNNIQYDISVVALSTGGNESLTALTGSGTPLPIDDFFTNYDKLNGAEQGGCAGGPAGLLSLLGLGALLGVLRRRS